MQYLNDRAALLDEVTGSRHVPQHTQRLQQLCTRLQVAMLLSHHPLAPMAE